MDILPNPYAMKSGDKISTVSFEPVSKNNLSGWLIESEKGFLGWREIGKTDKLEITWTAVAFAFAFMRKEDAERMAKILVNDVKTTAHEHLWY